MGEDTTGNPDTDSLNALHQQTLAIIAARQSGDAQALATAQAQWNNIASTRGGFTQAQLSAEQAEAEASGDPFGLKTVGDSLAKVAFWGAIGLGLWLIITKSGNRRRDF